MPFALHTPVSHLPPFALQRCVLHILVCRRQQISFWPPKSSRSASAPRLAAKVVVVGFKAPVAVNSIGHECQVHGKMCKKIAVESN